MTRKRQQKDAQKQAIQAKRLTDFAKTQKDVLKASTTKEQQSTCHTCEKRLFFVKSCRVLRGFPCEIFLFFTISLFFPPFSLLYNKKCVSLRWI